MKTFKPMLAASIKEPYSIHDLKYPLIASPKLDGIRCVIIDGVPLSRSLKPIQNLYIREKLSNPLLNGFDGELMVGDNHSFQDTTSGVMTRHGQPEFIFNVFDDMSSPSMPYYDRFSSYSKRIHELNNNSLSNWIREIIPISISSSKFLDEYLEKCLLEGYEGVMVRDACGPYKFGRATFKEGYLTKVKPLEDSEATIMGFVEQEANMNEATIGELGQTKRSTHQENKIGKGTLGALIVANIEFGRFNIGTGFDDALRKEIWNNTSKYIGRNIKFTYQAIGTKDKPRIPVFKGFRHPDDE